MLSPTNSPDAPAPIPPSRVQALPIKTWETPLVTYTLIAITGISFLLQLAGQYLLGEDFAAMWGMKVNELVVSGQFWRLITPVLLHGSILHIGFNMYALLSLGPGLERLYGHARFIALYLLAGFAGNVLSFWFSPNPSLGASTAIFGLLGAEGVFLYRNRTILGAGAQRALSNIVVIAVVNLIIGLSPGIDNWGHIGGLIAGTLFAWFAGPVFQTRGDFYSQNIVDQHSETRAAWTALAVWALFSILAGLRILLG